MSLKGQSVRIIVSEPFELTDRNLFGRIISEKSGTKLLVKLTNVIKGQKLISDLLELKPRFKDESFKPLLQNYSVTVNGALVTLESDEFDFVIIGSVTID